MPENRRPQRPTGKKTAAGRSSAPAGRGTGKGGGKQAAGRPQRGGQDRRQPDRQPDRRRAPERAERTKDQAAYDGPDLPEGITGAELDRSVTAQLKGLPEKLASRVARHLAAAGLFLDQDPELAYRHALAARARAPRLAVVREAARTVVSRTASPTAGVLQSARSAPRTRPPTTAPTCPRASPGTSSTAR